MASEQQLAAEVRASERRLYEHYGLETTERFVDAVGTSIRVVTIAGDPTLTPVLLLHGAASVTAAAIPLIPSFGGAPVIAIDWPGHGLSGAYRFDGETDLRDFASAIISAVTAEVERFDIVAHSLGGQFALYYCLAHPEKVRRVVLLGTPGAALGELPQGGGFQLLALPVIGWLVLRLPVTLTQYGKNSARTLGPGAVEPWPSELVEVGWYASRRHAFHTTMPGLFKAMIAHDDLRPGVAVSVEEMQALSIPTLFVWGDDDVFLSPEDAKPWTDAMPDATVVKLHAGHAPWLNKPEESAAAVGGFLRG